MFKIAAIAWKQWLAEHIEYLARFVHSHSVHHSNNQRRQLWLGLWRKTGPERRFSHWFEVSKGGSMFKSAFVWFIFTVASAIIIPAQASVICSFTGSGMNPGATTGTDCLGQPWNVVNGGWGIPGIGEGNIPWPGPLTATDFHWHCITGCQHINNGPQDDTQFSLIAGGQFGSTFWDETISDNGFTIDFHALSSADWLTQGRNFFVNITVPIDGPFEFVAWWTNDGVVPEPATLALLGMGLAGLGFSRRRKQ